MSFTKFQNNYISIAYEERPLNRIQSIKYSLSNKEINKFFELIKDVKLEEGMTGPNKNEGKLNKSVRRSKLYWIPRNEQFYWLYKKIVNLMLETNKNLWNFEITGVDILMQYTEYDESYQGYYDWHTDIGNTNNSKRKLSASIQLSSEDEYKGGELKFFDKKVANKDKGSMTIFPSYLLHKVEPVTKGKRKCLILWLTGPPFK